MKYNTLGPSNKLSTIRSRKFIIFLHEEHNMPCCANLAQCFSPCKWLQNMFLETMETTRMVNKVKRLHL